MDRPRRRLCEFAAEEVTDKFDFGAEELHVTSRNAEPVLIRRVRSEDRALYEDFLAGISAEDLKLRFFGDIAELTKAEMERLAHLDYRREMAFVALDERSERMLGVVRLKDELDEETTEYAILVHTQAKGHGIGWLLMQRAIEYAREKGLRRVYGDVLAENAGMLQMCAELGFHAHDMWSGVKRVVLDLGAK